MVEIDKLSLQEYIQYIHKLPWEAFVAESIRKSGTGYVQALYERAVATKAKAIVELGVMIGQSTRALLRAATENSGTLTSVESNGVTVQWVFEALKAGGIDTSPMSTIWGNDMDVAKTWTKPIDFLLIDTSHEYEHTLRELEAYSGFVTQNGVITMHDSYGEPVKRAIDDFVAAHMEWVFEDITPPNDGWGLALLRRKRD